MKAVTSSKMKEIDSQTSQRFGVPSLVLMENAGATVADLAISEFGAKNPVIVCGKGGNGGDGFVAARHLAMNGIECKVFLLASTEDLSGDPQVNFGILAKGFSGCVELSTGATDGNLGRLSAALRKSDLIIDCLLGTGLTDAPTGVIAQAIELVNSVNVPVLACDMPSGVDGSTGKVPGLAVYADLTCTFGLPKIGHFLYPGAQYTGKLVLSNVGFPDVLLCDEEIQSSILTDSEAANLIPERKMFGHKGDYGKVLIVGGSKDYPGAPMLSGLACMRTGAGLTNVLVPESIFSSVAGRYPEMIVHSAPANEEGSFAHEAAQVALRHAFGASCVVVGPGLSKHNDLAHLVSEIMGKIEVPVIIDADGLNVLARSPQGLLLRAEHGWPTILTPHWGEAGRFGTTAMDIVSNPIAVAKRFSSRFGVITVLKSARTIIAEPKGNFYINVTGNSSLSKGGSGDVLSGIIAGLVAQGLDPFNSGVVGSYLLGAAAEKVSEEIGEYGVLSTQIADAVPRIIKELKS